MLSFEQTRKPQPTTQQAFPPPSNRSFTTPPSGNHTQMDQFVVQAQHSGSISLAHSFLFPAHAVQLAREVRLAVTIVAVAWVTVSALGAWRDRPGRRE
ncbi:hypothetical protein E4U16_002040 [Claviceps sp. LM84 group G4]|nr:hypothetical protein E4U33_001812 [Claviceps sp. LM78 group G4]KAG6077756.1 hypothetical protein E4U16_002040 [Claviceps sp. LM84 group G4]